MFFESSQAQKKLHQQQQGPLRSSNIEEKQFTKEQKNFLIPYSLQPSLLNRSKQQSTNRGSQANVKLRPLLDGNVSTALKTKDSPVLQANKSTINQSKLDHSRSSNKIQTLHDESIPHVNESQNNQSSKVFDTFTDHFENRHQSYQIHPTVKTSNTNKSLMKISQTEDSILAFDNPMYSKLYETNYKISLKREDALNLLMEQIKTVLSQDKNATSKNSQVLSDALSSLLETIQNAQQNEMELNKAMRQMQKQIRDNTKLKVESSIQKNQNRLGNEELFLYKQKYQGLNTDLRILQKENLHLQLQNDDLRKKNQTYEKRLELLSDYNSFAHVSAQHSTLEDQDSILISGHQESAAETSRSKDQQQQQQQMLQTATSQTQKSDKNLTSSSHPGGFSSVLSELVKENENMKKIIKLREKEIERVKDLNYKQQDKINRLYKKIDMIKMKRMSKEEETKQSVKPYSEEDKFNFEENELPLTIDFKTQSLSVLHQNFLGDLLEHGKESFISQFEEDRKEHIELVVNQLQQFRQFGEKINSVLQEMLFILNVTTFEELMLYISRNIKHNFQANQVRLWIRDAQTGVLKTINESGKELKALTTKGLFSKALDQQKIMNCSTLKGIQLYQDIDGKIQQSERTVLFPLSITTNDQQGHLTVYQIGLLEVSEIQKDSLEIDEQYIGLLISKVLRFTFKRLQEQDIIQKQLRVSKMNEEFLQELCKSQTKFQFTQTIIRSVNSILQSSACTFAFVEEGEMSIYSSETNVTKYKSSVGLASRVIQEQKSMIFYDCKKQPEFQQGLDISSILPVYVHPLVVESNENKASSKVVGVLSFVMKSRKKPPQNLLNEAMIINQGFLSQDIDYHIFCQYILSAFHLVFLRPK